MPEPSTPPTTARHDIVGDAVVAGHLVKLGAVLIMLVLIAAAELVDGRPALAAGVGGCAVGVALLLALRRAARTHRSAEWDGTPQEPWSSGHDEPGEASP